MNWFFIINPGSNHKKGATFIPFLLSELDKRNIEYQYKITSSLDDARQLSLEANEKNFDIIVAVGGDGTINQVLNGFLDEQGKRISTSKFGVIHTGTSPDFCLSYDIPTNSISALETLLKGFTKEISVAKIAFHSKTGMPQTGYFACCASFGLGAQVAEFSNSGIRKYLGDTLGTFASILLSLFKYKPTDLHLICDGKEMTVEKNFNTFIGKTSFIASGLKVKHLLSANDQRLYLLSLSKINFLNVIPALISIYSGKDITKRDYISLSYFKTIEIRNNKNQEIEFDGDPQGYLPCRISVATDRLELITNEF